MKTKTSFLRLTVSEAISSAPLEHRREQDVLIADPKVKLSQDQIGEMQKVLYLAEKHAIVSPRRKLSTVVNLEISNLLPEYSVVPLCDPKCLVVKGSIWNRYRNLLSPCADTDETLYGFCLGLNNYGYSSISANRVSIGHTWGHFDFSNEFDTKYQFIRKALEIYFSKDIHPLEHFEEVYPLNPNAKPSVLFSLYNAIPAYNGTNIGALIILKNLVEKHLEDLDIKILVNPEADKFFNISDKYENVVYPHDLKGVYSMAYVPYQIYSKDHLRVLNKSALKIVFHCLDIISIRSLYLSSETDDAKRAIILSSQFSDGIITNSNFTKEDFTAYLKTIVPRSDFPEVRPVVLGVIKPESNGTFKKPFDKYILVLGNQHYIHKKIADTYELVAKNDTGRNYVFVGLTPQPASPSNVIAYESGQMEQGYVEFLHRNCEAVLFPSEYEGFGLPIADAAVWGKPVILQDNDVNREVVELLKGVKPMFYRNESELFGILRDQIPGASEEGDFIGHFRKYSDAAEEIALYLKDICKKEVDVQKLERRWSLLGSIESERVQRDISISGLLKMLIRKVGKRVRRVVS